MGPAVSAAGHAAGSPDWLCRRCAQPWPCAELRATPELLAVVSALMTTAIRDFRGRPGGPEPIEVVRRFLWWLPVSHDEARAIALRMR
ncbi:hypothetical protein [Micromonospora sp. KC207]|uniref:hypothetical protein n=1 Tax=Micromonospora sp. KC207 TaxID=2530377 RepID=UPI001FB6524C|nr:hypothetical protein [Micromonospora sp. KC207]